MFEGVKSSVQVPRVASVSDLWNALFPASAIMLEGRLKLFNQVAKV